MYVKKLYRDANHKNIVKEASNCPKDDGFGEF